MTSFLAEKTIESPKKSAPGRGDPDPFIDFGLEDEELLDDEDFSGHILPLSKMDKKEKEKSQGREKYFITTHLGPTAQRKN